MQPKIIAANSGKKLNVLGNNHHWRLTGAETNGALLLVEQRDVPGTRVPMHVHEREDETFVVLEGEVKFVAGGTTTVVTAGMTVWAPRGIPHSFEIVGSKPAHFLVYISPAGIEGMFEELSKLPPGPQDFAKVGEICGRFGCRFV